MASRDQFQRFLFEHSQVRGAWVQLADSYQEIGSQAPYPDTDGFFDDVYAGGAPSP